MSEKELKEFDTTLHKTNAILNQLEDELGWQDRRNQTYAAMRTVLHTLRDRMLPQEVVQLASQMPMLLSGVFIHGWKLKDKPDKMNLTEFFERIQNDFPYSIEGGLPELVRAVWRVLQKNISAGAMDDIKSGLPKDIVRMLESRETTGPLPAM